MLHLSTWLCEQWKGTIQLPNNLTTDSAKDPGHIWGNKRQEKYQFHVGEAEQTVLNNLRQLENQQGERKVHSELDRVEIAASGEVIILVTISIIIIIPYIR